MPWKTALSAGASIWGTHQYNRNIDKQLGAQSVENAKNRKYNLELAKLQNDWNRQQWQLENAYNSPAAQMERLRQAGLNPDMMYGGSVTGNLSASSPQMTAGAPSSSMDWNALGSKRTIGDTILQAKQMDMMDAQIDNVEADTRNKGFEGDILASDAAFRDAYNTGVLETQHMQIELGNSQKELNMAQAAHERAQIEKCEKEAQLLNERVQEIRASVANLDADTALKKVTAACMKAKNSEEIKEIKSRYNLNAAQTEAILEKYPQEVLLMKDEHGFNMENGLRIKMENNRIAINMAKELQSFKNQRLGVAIYDGLELVNEITKAVSPFISHEVHTETYTETEYDKKGKPISSATSTKKKSR